MHSTCRFLDLPVELQQEIYDRCDIHSRIRLNHVLKKKFSHKTDINKTLLLIAYALKHDKTYVNNNININTFLSNNQEDGSVRCLLSKYNIVLEKLDDFNLLCKSMRNHDIGTAVELLTVEFIEKLDKDQLNNLMKLIYKTSVEMFERIWGIPGGRMLIEKTVLKDMHEQRLLFFNVINYGNCELAKHLFSLDAQNKYGFDVEFMKYFILGRWIAFADRVPCLAALFESIDVPAHIMQCCLKEAINTMAVDAFKFLKERGVRLMHVI